VKPAGADLIHKVTIIPRGMALGLTQQLPVDEKHTYSTAYLLNNLVILFGGRVAEELALKRTTTGPAMISKGDRSGAPDGLRVGHERKLGPRLSAKRRRDFSGKRFYPESRLFKTTARDRRCDQAHYPRGYNRAKNLLLLISVCSMKLPRRPRKGGSGRLGN
jgi:cell division protease FtsH